MLENFLQTILLQKKIPLSGKADKGKIYDAKIYQTTGLFSGARYLLSVGCILKAS